MLLESIIYLEDILMKRCGKVNTKSMKLLAYTIDNLDERNVVGATTLKLSNLLYGNDDTKNLARDVKSCFVDCNLGTCSKLKSSYSFSFNKETLELVQNLSITSEKLASEFTPDDQISKTLTKESNNKGVTLTSREKSTPAKSMKIDNIQYEYNRDVPGYEKKRAGSLSAVIDSRIKGGDSEETMERIKHIHDKNDDWMEY